MRRIVKWLALALIAAVFICAGSIPFVLPVFAAYACPGCYGLEPLTQSLFAEAAMSPEDRAKLQAAVASAEAKVTGFYGSFNAPPTLLACVSLDCDRKLGGRGARAVTYSILNRSIIRLSPNGLNETILAHEFSHAELRRRLGLKAQWMGAVPAWFDEGVAVAVSGDDSYLIPNATGAGKCMAAPAGPLPAAFSDWSRLAGQTPGLDAQAACSVVLWMEPNGGKPGLLTARMIP